jgi:hypothetical protein
VGNVRENESIISLPEAIRKAELPSRLLKLKTPLFQAVELVEIRSLDQLETDMILKTGFVSLSYCWGGDQPQKLTRQSLPLYTLGVSVHSFPKTIQEAIWYTKNIGLDYLWIDSLCIVQDDQDDKEREIARMAIYYGASTVTICAASSFSSQNGFLHPREEPEFVAGPFKLPFQVDGDLGSVILYSDEPEVYNSVEPTTTRGWTLQESMLSRRILIFASRQLYWTCCRSNATCGGRFGTFQDRNMGDPASYVSGIHPITTIWNQPPLTQWMVICKDFASRKIGVAGDKLLAVSALAAHLSPLFTERDGDTVYLAGLFFILVEPISMVYQLLWYTDFQHSKRPKEYRAPSWSLACVDGPLEFLYDFTSLPSRTSGSSGKKQLTKISTWGGVPNQRVYTFTVTMELQDYQAKLSNKAAPYGAVVSGYIEIRAPLKVITTKNPHLRSIATILNTGNQLDELDSGNEGAPWLALIPDSNEDCTKLRASLTRDTSSVYCLELIAADSHVLSAGLLLEPVPTTANARCFSRVGVYVFGSWDLVLPETELNFRARESFFWDGGAEVVRLL